MASKFKVPDKKTLVAIIIIAVLLIAAIVGTVAFLKNRGTAEATELENYEEQSTATTQEEQSTTDTQEQSGETATPGNEEQTTEPAGDAETADTTTTGGNQGTAGTGATGGATGTTGGTTTTATDNIEETTISREETVTTQERYEDRTWEQTDLEAPIVNVYTDIVNSVQTPNITVEKEAKTESGSTLAQQGEEITYTIKVKNNTDEKVERIYVTDAIPEGTTYVSSTEDVETFADEKGNVTSLRWLVDIEADSTTTLQFKVRVNEDATGTIENIAIANGEESNPTDTAIITTNKSSVITRDETQVDVAKVGDIITYTISVENTGDVAGTVTVKDADLATILENNAEMHSDVTVGDKTYKAEELISGISVNVAPKTTATVVFSVKVTNINGAITNVALVGDNEEETNTDETDTANLVVNKEVTSKPDNGKKICFR